MSKQLCGLLCVFAISGCSSDVPLDEHTPPETRSASAATTLRPKKPIGELPAEEANNVLAFDLYAQFCKRPGNLAFSPYSISSGLAMVYAGASGETKEEIAKAAHFSAPDQVNSSFSALRETLGAHEEEHRLTVRLANRLWGDRSQNFLPEYVAATTKHYGAELAVVDFASETEGARQEINAWIEEQTDSQLKEALPPGAIGPGIRLALVSAIYFAGRWAYPFSVEQTASEDFELASGERISAPTMKKDFAFPYADVDHVQIMELPYRSSEFGEYAMFVLLPPRGGLEALEARLTAETFDTWTELVKERRLEIHLPRFTLSSILPLNRAFNELGVRRLFESGEANLSAMSNDPTLFVQDAAHAAVIRVDEEGTVAAAATRFLIGGIDDDKPVLFRADHPFLFVIRHNPSKTILFIGRVANPLG